MKHFLKRYGVYIISLAGLITFFAVDPVYALNFAVPLKSKWAQFFPQLKIIGGVVAGASLAGCCFILMTGRSEIALKRCSWTALGGIALNRVPDVVTFFQS